MKAELDTLGAVIHTLASALFELTAAIPTFGQSTQQSHSLDFGVRWSGVVVALGL